MANLALARLETALRARKLDRTLTTTLPSADESGAAAATGVDALDACLRGGLPRGQLSEVAGPRSSGRTTVLLQLLRAATRRGEIAALVDPCDRLDIASAAEAGIDLDRLLWIRGAATADPGRSLPSQALVERTVDRALKALNLVLQAGGFGLVAIDLADVPVAALQRLPFTTWLRVQRAVEARETACVLVVSKPLARSAGGLTLTLAGAIGWAGAADRSRRLDRLNVAARIVSPRRRVDGTVTVGARCVHA
jgi:hypothetical protein